MSGDASKTTDTIPRASIAQILRALHHLASAGKSTFDAVRRHLYQQSGRRAPASETVLWTVARDSLTELQRLGYATVGVLPRRRSDVGRLGDSPCEATESGKALCEVMGTKPGQAYDALLVAWLNTHPYFRSLISRVLASSLYVPDVTSAAQIGDSRAVADVTARVLTNCLDRLGNVNFPRAKADRFDKALRARMAIAAKSLALPDLDSKKLVDLIQDTVVIPSFLEAEDLPFDSVTFEHLLRTGGEFLAVASTSSYPDFTGRVVFSTSDFFPSPNEGETLQASTVQHHGVSHARPRFSESLLSAYSRVTGSSGGYADAYTVRAIVCLDLRVQPPVFASCLKELIAAGVAADPVVYTELPFTPPPQGESYVEVGGRRIGRLKLTSQRGG